jgi:hypothetical protein
MKRSLKFVVLGLVFATNLYADVPSFEIVFNDGVIKPQILKVPSDEKFQIVIKNEGKTAEEFHSDDLNRERILAPGKKAILALGPLKSGSYAYMAEFHANLASAQGQIVAE